jgi:hypothetical protein
LFLFGFLGTVLVIVIVFAMMVLYHRTESEFQLDRTVNQPYIDMENARLDQEARLATYGRLDTAEPEGPSRAEYHVPIERAMDAVLADWKSGKLPGPAPKPSPPSDPADPPAEPVPQPETPEATAEKPQEAGVAKSPPAPSDGEDEEKEAVNED